MLQNQRNLYNLNPDICYLNMAYMSPSLKAVSLAGVKSIKEKENPHTVTADNFFDPPQEIKKLFAQIIDCDDVHRIALLPSASYGIATVANNIKLNTTDEVMVIEEQFPSNMYSWKRLVEKSNAKLKLIDTPTNAANKSELWNKKILGNINSNTKVVAMPHCHWAEGSLYNLINIRKKCDEVGALLVIDGSQSIGALPFSIKEIKPDALITVGYKWLGGPYSSAYAYYGKAFDNGVPLEENWMQRVNSEDFRTLVNYEEKYKEKAARYNVGQSSNFINLPMQKVALTQILDWGAANIQAYCRKISASAIDDLRANNFFIDDDNFRAGHLFGIKLKENTNVTLLQQMLKDEKIIVSLRGDYIRVSPYVYNDENDFEKLTTILLKA